MGGMAELFLGEVAGAHGFAKTVVIKRILPHLAANEQFKKMFITEAKITAQLAHPKIAQTFELGNEGKQLFIVMEFIDGLDVLALLRECAHRRVRVPEEITVYIIKEVLDALDFAHNLHSADGKHLGIVHRDVSPSNVLLSKRGDVKLIDFGIAHAAEGDAKTKSGTLKGKYGYMSPEQVLAQEVTPKSDIFAAGVVMAEMLMGRRLFAAANELDVLLMVRDVDLSRLERFGDHIQPELSNLLRWALRKDPGDRYKDAKTFRDSLDEWLFEQRHRIGSSQLAEIVNSLYEDAAARRLKGIEEAEGGPSAANEGGGENPEEELAATDAPVMELAATDAPEMERAKKDTPEIELTAVDVPEIELAEKDSPNTDLLKSDLRKSELRKSDLRKSDLRKSDLRKSDLRKSDLRKSDLRKTNLREPNLSESDLSDKDRAEKRQLVRRAPKPSAAPLMDLSLDDEPESSKPAPEKPKKEKTEESSASKDLGAALEMDLAKPEVPLIKSRKPKQSVDKPKQPVDKPPPKASGSGDAIVNFELAPADSMSIELGPTIADEEGEDEDIDMELDDDDELDVDEESGSFEIDFEGSDDSESDEKEDRASKPFPPKKAPSYDSISDAVASVSPLAPDPASMDFDDSRVSSDSKVGRITGRINAADLEQSAPPKPLSLKQDDEEPDHSGSLKDRSALAALYETTAARESGKLALSLGGVRKEIYFKRGVPEFVSSNIASELFGAYLVRMEVISSGELDMALAVMPHFGGKLGDTLVGLGLMKPLEVFRHLTRQVRSKLIEVCTWIDGSYEWFPGTQCPKQAFPLDLDPLEVYGAGALAMDRKELDVFFEINKERKYAAALSSVVVPELFQVSGIRKYQDKFDGTRSLSEVVETLDKEDDELRDLQVVYLLINTKLIKEAEDSI